MHCRNVLLIFGVELHKLFCRALRRIFICVKLHELSRRLLLCYCRPHCGYRGMWIRNVLLNFSDCMFFLPHWDVFRGFICIKLLELSRRIFLRNNGPHSCDRNMPKG